MNEKINKLIDLATTRAEFYTAGCNGYPEYRDDFNKEKFAELIIRECLDITSKVSKNPYIPNVDQAGKINREIKKHFGVE